MTSLDTRARSVTLPLFDGQRGVARGHSPFIGRLGAGEVRITGEQGGPADAVRRVFVEGGGVTVSAFLEANLLDRLQIAIAPVLIGDGRPAIRLAPQARLRDCLRPGYRVFRMGGDVLFDCEMNSQTNTAHATDSTPAVTRVI